MKYFKHISDSLDDPFIFSLLEKFGGNGYLIFFGIIEIYAREFKTYSGWKLDVTLSYLCRKFVLTRKNTVLRVLSYIRDSTKWQIEISNNLISINIPKFKELLDEYTLKKLSQYEKNVGTASGQHRDSIGTVSVTIDKDKDKDKYKENIKEKNAQISFDALFEKFWISYPRKISKKDAYRALKKLEPDEEDIEALKLQIKKQSVAGGILDPKEKGQFIPYPATWLNKELWR